MFANVWIRIDANGKMCAQKHWTHNQFKQIERPQNKKRFICIQLNARKKVEELLAATTRAEIISKKERCIEIKYHCAFTACCLSYTSSVRYYHNLYNNRCIRRSTLVFIFNLTDRQHECDSVYIIRYRSAVYIIKPDAAYCCLHQFLLLYFVKKWERHTLANGNGKHEHNDKCLIESYI